MHGTNSANDKEIPKFFLTLLQSVGGSKRGTYLVTN